MRKYEAVFILDPRKVEGDGEAFSDSIVENFKNNGGTVEPIAKIKDQYRLNQTVLRLVFFNFEDGQDDTFFNPPENRAKLFQEDFFGDSFDHDDRPYRGYGGSDEN